MAGIGFELRKLFREKGIVLYFRANLYAGIVVAGPMLLGVIMLLGMKYFASFAGASRHDQDQVVVILTYSILFPLILTSFVSFVTTRYVADELYENHFDRVLPSMYGAISICLPLGAVGWAIFLFISNLPFQYSFFSFMLFCEAVVVWIQITYVNAAKDYRSALLGFGLGILIGLLAAFVSVFVLHLEIISSLLASASLAYGVMIISYTVVLHSYFPLGRGSSLKFLEWVEKYPTLVLVGFFTTAGLFIHIFLMWASPWGIKVTGMFYHAPAYDIPALLAMLTTLVTTVRFVTSVELAFYPKYRLYFGLLNGGSNLNDLNKASQEMITVMKQELFYLAQIQILVELIIIALAGSVIPRLGLGFTPGMIALFRVLCVGYGLYAIGNSLILFLLYLSNYRDAMIASFTLFIISALGTALTLAFPDYYYGFGFVMASLCTFLIAWLRLSIYIERLDYNIFCKQPIFIKEKNGWLTRLARRLDNSQA
jgi:polysaccharide biosynthesis protein PelG